MRFDFALPAGVQAVALSLTDSDMSALCSGRKGRSDGLAEAASGLRFAAVQHLSTR